jgi:catechol 2,3-dioxygenase-like lactoylglutathione lyase family enzyme
MAKAPWTVQWIDHYVVPSNDLNRHMDFMKNVLGAVLPERLMWLTTRHRLRNAPLPVFTAVGHYHHNGGFLQNRMLPDPQPLGQGTPRYGYYVRESDLDAHLKRLDSNDVSHTDPRVVSHEGEEGTVVYLADYDGNQYEFWAPKQMPVGAMEADNPLRIGRISHVVLETRDLQRTIGWADEFLGLVPLENDDLEENTLVFRLGGGGRMIYKEVNELSDRTGSHNKWTGQHAALLLTNDEFVPAYQYMWSKLPESQHRRFQEEVPDETNMAPRTELHGLIALREREAKFQRGTTFYDWDTNTFHYVGGIPQDGSIAHYKVGYNDNNVPDTAYVAQEGVADLRVPG